PGAAVRRPALGAGVPSRGGRGDAAAEGAGGVDARPGAPGVGHPRPRFRGADAHGGGAGDRVREPAGGGGTGRGRGLVGARLQPDPGASASTSASPSSPYTTVPRCPRIVGDASIAFRIASSVASITASNSGLIRVFASVR